MDGRCRFARSLVFFLLPFAFAGAAWPAEPNGAAAALRVDEDDPHCSDATGKPFCTLGAAIRAANARPGPDTIDLPDNQIFSLPQPATKSVTEGDTGLPAIAGDLTLHGHGSTVERIRANLTPPFR